MTTATPRTMNAIMREAAWEQVRDAVAERIHTRAKFWAKARSKERENSFKHREFGVRANEAERCYEVAKALTFNYGERQRVDEA